MTTLSNSDFSKPTQPPKSTSTSLSPPTTTIIYLGTTFGHAQYIIEGAFSSQEVRFCYLASLSLCEGLPWAWRPKVDLLSSDDVVAASGFFGHSTEYLWEGLQSSMISIAG